MATALPWASDFAFSAISVFASSISSRTRRDALVETSPTTSPSDLSALVPFSLIVSASECLQHLRDDEAADERADHGNLRTADRVGSLVRVPGGLRSVCRCAALHQSGGSSPNTLTQITVATRVVAIVARAPRPASSPLQTRRLTNSFCISAGI